MDQTQELEIIQERYPSKFKRFLLVLLVTAILLGSAAYAAGYILLKGPSPYVGEQLVKMVGEHPVAQVVLKLYMTDDELMTILTAEDDVNRFSVFPVVE